MVSGDSHVKGVLSTFKFYTIYKQLLSISMETLLHIPYIQGQVINKTEGK